MLDFEYIYSKYEHYSRILFDKYFGRIETKKGERLLAKLNDWYEYAEKMEQG